MSRQAVSKTVHGFLDLGLICWNGSMLWNAHAGFKWCPPSSSKHGARREGGFESRKLLSRQGGFGAHEA